MPCPDDPCHSPQAPIRPRYFTGQLLTVDDLQAEQDYSMHMRSRHDRALHGAGVVCGLEVNPSGDGTVVVSAGTAVDPCGREIVVPEAVTLQIGATSQGAEAEQEMDVVLRYVEHQEGPGTPEGEPAWIADGYEADVRAQGTAGPDEVVLAYVRRSEDGRMIILENAAHHIPSVQELAQLVDRLQARIAALESGFGRS